MYICIYVSVLAAGFHGSGSTRLSTTSAALRTEKIPTGSWTTWRHCSCSAQAPSSRPTCLILRYLSLPLWLSFSLLSIYLSLSLFSLYFSLSHNPISVRLFLPHESLPTPLKFISLFLSSRPTYLFLFPSFLIFLSLSLTTKFRFSFFSLSASLSFLAFLSLSLYFVSVSLQPSFCIFVNSFICKRL